MAVSQVILEGQGPLPLKATFTAISNLPTNIYISATAFTKQPQWMEVIVRIDGNRVAAAKVFTNEVNVHRTLLSSFTPIELSVPDEHTVQLEVFDQFTLSDSTDYYCVTLIY
jgi:hypothetical protein